MDSLLTQVYTLQRLTAYLSWENSGVIMKLVLLLLVLLACTQGVSIKERMEVAEELKTMVDCSSHGPGLVSCVTDTGPTCCPG